MTLFAMLVLVGFFVLVTGFFAGSETALMSLNRMKLRHLADGGDRNAKIIQSLLEDPDHLFIMILIGTNLAIVLASSGFSAYLIQEGNPFAEELAILIVTPLLLIFGEIIPKSLFRHNAFFLVTALTPLLSFFCKVLSPIATVLRSLNNQLLWLLGQKGIHKQPLFVTKAELKYLIQESEQRGILKPHERSIIYRIFDLGEKNVKKIMTSFERIVSLSSSSTIEEMMTELRQSRFSWVPIYEGNPKQFAGFVSLFDVAFEEDVDKPLSHFLRPLVSVPEEMAVDEVLVVLQKKKSTMALVENVEQKTIVGLVTIDDLLNELVGGV